jgi:hypothetical protein
VITIPLALVVAYVYSSTDYNYRRQKDSINLYESFQREEEMGHPGFKHVLDWINIDQDGGIDNIQSLDINGPRLFLCCLKTVGAISNSCILIALNVSILKGCLYELRGGDDENMPLALKTYLSLTSRSRLLNFPEVAVISLAELMGVFLIVCVVIFRWVFFVRTHGQKNMAFARYSSLYHMFETTKMLSIFSVLRLFGMCHPALVARRLKEHMADHDNMCARVFFAAYFIITRSCAAVLSILAFGVKLAMVSIQFYVVDAHPLFIPAQLAFFWRWAVVIQLFVQTFSILDMEEVLKWRLFAIVSGGQDATPDHMETLVMQVYRARISQGFYDVYWARNRRFAFFVIFMTFNDVDLQLLMFEENDRKKQARTRMINHRSMGGLPPPLELLGQKSCSNSCALM